MNINYFPRTLTRSVMSVSLCVWLSLLFGFQLLKSESLYQKLIFAQVHLQNIQVKADCQFTESRQ